MRSTSSRLVAFLFADGNLIHSPAGGLSYKVTAVLTEACLTSSAVTSLPNRSDR